MIVLKVVKFYIWVEIYQSFISYSDKDLVRAASLYSKNHVKVLLKRMTSSKRMCNQQFLTVK